MEEEIKVTTYESSDGSVVEIKELNNFHLMNALLKLNDILSLNPNGFGTEKGQYIMAKLTHKALKEEVLRRLAPEVKLLENPESITVCNLEVIVMPNGEILSSGKSIGMLQGEVGKYISIKK
jgi:hypothetical protein